MSAAWLNKVSFVFFLLVLVATLSRSNISKGQSFAASADVSSSLSISLEGGRNYRGRDTRIFNNNLNFGSVSFLNPDLINNGDAFLENSYLILEATLKMTIVGNGYTQGQILANRQISTSETFSKVRSSTSDLGTENSIDILFEPSVTQIKTFDTNTTELSIRFLYYIDRSQSGSFADTINLTALAT
ncbi:MAG: hypothetical protein ABH859_03885 [Pseudomonadota bacterium]